MINSADRGFPYPEFSILLTAIGVYSSSFDYKRETVRTTIR